MIIEAEKLTGGFADPVFDSQEVFRLLMDGMARPGTVKAVAPETAAPGLSQAAGAIALTLADRDTPVWLSAGLQKSALPAWLTFHTGAVLAAEKAEAHFAFVEAGLPLPSLGLFSVGAQDYPDRSATVIVEISGFEAPRALKLSGPGIAGSALVRPSGLPDGFIRQWTDNHALFPRGVDVVLTAGQRFLCLPRTVRIVETEV